MSPFKSIFLVVFLVVFIAGCSQTSAKKSKAKSKAATSSAQTGNTPASPVIEDTHLAKVILKQDNKPLSVNRDPFKPLLQKDLATWQEINKDLVRGDTQDNLSDIKLMGVIKIGDESKAYLMVKDKMSMYQVKDQVREYTISKIDRNEVEFKSDTNIVVKKRGDNEK